MCSLGHHDGPDMAERPKRRHLDRSASARVRSMPKAELARRQAEVKASLIASRDTAIADELAAGHEADQLELIPRDMEQLPPRLFKTRELPDPSSLYYSSARD